MRARWVSFFFLHVRFSWLVLIAKLFQHQNFHDLWFQCVSHTLFSFTYLSISHPHPLTPFLSVRSPCWLARSRSQPAIRQLLLLQLESLVVSQVSGIHLDPLWLQPTHSPGTLIYVGCMSVCMRVAVWCEVSWCQLCAFSLSRLTHCHMDKSSQPPDCILCMRYQSRSSRHPSTADEAYCWPKCVLHNGFA